MKSLIINLNSFFYKNKYSTLFFGYSGIIVFITASVFYFYVGGNPVKYKIGEENILFALVPQGWAYFTRSPREAQITILKRSNNDNKFVRINLRHSHPDNLFGLYRRSPKILTELQRAKLEIPESIYLDTTWNYQQQHSTGDIKKLLSYNFINKIKDPELCGEHLVIYQKPIPWAWLTNRDKIKMACKMIKINFVCN